MTWKQRSYKVQILKLPKPNITAITCCCKYLQHQNITVASALTRGKLIFIDSLILSNWDARCRFFLQQTASFSVDCFYILHQFCFCGMRKTNNFLYNNIFLIIGAFITTFDSSHCAHLPDIHCSDEINQFN